MDELKELFGTEALTYDAFEQKLAAAGADKINLANLASGKYIEVNKHNREVDEARKTTVSTSKEYMQLAAERDDFKSKYEGLVAENAKKESMAKVGEKVAPDFVEFVYDKVAKAMASDNKKTFDNALDEVLKASPQYKKSTAPIIKVSSGLKQENKGSGDEASASMAITRQILRAAGRTPQD